MKRDACMFKAKPNMADEFKRGVRAIEVALQDALEKTGAKNASLWAVGDFLYAYAEFDDDNPHTLKDIISPWAKDISTFADTVAEPDTMRLMYRDLGVVRENKSDIRRRVFATRLKPNCADEYYSRHKALMDVRHEKPADGLESNFSIFCANGEYIFGYCELVRAYIREETPEEHENTVKWETRQLGIMDWLTDDVDWLTHEKHPKMECLFMQKGFE